MLLSLTRERTRKKHSMLLTLDIKEEKKRATLTPYLEHTYSIL
jgi:hypothetical protein